MKPSCGHEQTGQIVSKPTKQSQRCTDLEVSMMRELHEQHGLGYKRIAAKMELPVATVQSICTYRRR